MPPTWSTPGSRSNSRKSAAAAGPFFVRDKRAREMGKRRSEAKVAVQWHLLAQKISPNIGPEIVRAKPFEKDALNILYSTSD